MNDRSMIPMQCGSCYNPTGCLNVPIKDRNLGDELIDRDIYPLCQKCYLLWRAAAVQDP